MKAIATIALMGLVLFVAGSVTGDNAMADAGVSAFILGSLVVSALSMRRRHRKKQPRCSTQGRATRRPAK